MKKLFCLFNIILLSTLAYSQSIIKKDIIEANDELIIRDTTIIDLIDQHSSSATLSSGSGIEISGNQVDWNGALDQNVSIPGNAYDVSIGTNANRIGQFDAYSTDYLHLTSSGIIQFNSNGSIYSFSGGYFVSSGGDTLGTWDKIRELITYNKDALALNFGYALSSSITDSRPGVGLMRLNNVSAGSVTEIYIDDFDENNINKSIFIQLADTGSYFYLTERGDETNAYTYEISGIIDNSGYTTYSVSFVNSTGAIPFDDVRLGIINRSGSSTFDIFEYIDLDTSNTIPLFQRGRIYFDSTKNALSVQTIDNKTIYLGDTIFADAIQLGNNSTYIDSTILDIDSINTQKITFLDGSSLIKAKVDSSIYSDTSFYALKSDSIFTTIISDTVFYNYAVKFTGESGVYIDSNSVTTDTAIVAYQKTGNTIIDSTSIEADSLKTNVLKFNNTRIEDTLLYMEKYLPNSNYYSWIDFFSSDYDISIRAVQADTSFAGLSIDNYGFQAKSYPNIYNPAQDWDIKELVLGGEINDRYELKSNKYDNSVYSRIGIKPDYIFLSAGATVTTDTMVKITSSGISINGSESIYNDSDTIKSPNIWLRFKGFLGNVFRADTLEVANAFSIGGGDVLITSDTIDLKTAVESESFDKIMFNPTTQTHSEGLIFYDEHNYSLAAFSDIPGFKEILGKGINIRFYNNTGSTITRGTLITSAGAKVNGAVTFTAKLAGNGSLDSLQGVAMAVTSVLNNNYGIARLAGQIDSLNTSMYVDNQLLWVGSGGTLIDTIPEAPNFSNLVARVVYADADSGAIYMFPISQIEYNPNPDLSVSFNRESETINNPGQNISALITNATNNLYTEDYNVGFNFVGDSINPKQYGVYSIDYSHAFQGDAATGDDWRVGIFKNGIELSTVVRTSSSASKGIAASSKIVSLGTSDWISLRVINTTSATRDAIFIDGVINVEFISLQ